MKGVLITVIAVLAGLLVFCLVGGGMSLERESSCRRVGGEPIHGSCYKLEKKEIVP